MGYRSKTWAVSLLAATFVAGAAVGVGTGALWMKPPQRGPAHLLDVLSDELRLAPSQRDSVGAVIWSHWNHTNGLWDTVKPRFDTLRADMDSQLVRLLTPDQATRYRSLIVERRRRREQEGRSTGTVPR
jgi:hypothetical protein